MTGDLRGRFRDYLVAHQLDALRPIGQLRPTVFVLFGLLLLLHLPAARADWQLRDVPKNSVVSVYTRSIEGSEFKAFKGVVEVSADITTVLSVLRDYASYPQWYHNNVETKVIDPTSSGEPLIYAVTEAPWPLADRDSVTRVSVEADDVDASSDASVAGVPKFVRLKVTAEPDGYPLQKGRVRIPELNGSWQLESVDEETTLVTFSMAADPGGEVPAFVANSVVIEMPLKTLTKFKARCESKES